MISRWEFSKDFLEEVAFFKLNFEVRVKFGQETWLEMGGDGVVKVVKAFQVAMSTIGLNHVKLLIFYCFTNNIDFRWFNIILSR